MIFAACSVFAVRNNIFVFFANNQHNSNNGRAPILYFSSPTLSVFFGRDMACLVSTTITPVLYTFLKYSKCIPNNKLLILTFAAYSVFAVRNNLFVFCANKLQNSNDGRGSSYIFHQPLHLWKVYPEQGYPDACLLNYLNSTVEKP